MVHNRTLMCGWSTELLTFDRYLAFDSAFSATAISCRVFHSRVFSVSVQVSNIV